jgi:hypothetical protein
VNCEVSGQQQEPTEGLYESGRDPLSKGRGGCQNAGKADMTAALGKALSLIEKAKTLF